MTWAIEYDPRVRKDLERLDKSVQRKILDYMETRVARAHNPRDFGKALRHGKRGLWRYRIEAYRVICQIQDARLVVLVVGVGHRSAVYDE